jgi:calcineurin-like phosphoesterase family protein
MTIFLTADIHCGHANVIQYSGRPFADVEAMDMALIANWGML